ncbi:molybdenum cofactor biosynthesis protein MoaE [Synechococcus sp. MIT S9504]|uniref:molybdopterin synthase catalytic subunit n=1 Tax=Synechococcus sp. MIT S9504 TaxID=1801628 RepID=UPI001E5E5783|nr:molybdenum cofactor biosynthesis protein MoaE [Synechococcus sp. MIT S9504]
MELDAWLRSQMGAATAMFMGRVRDVAMDGRALEVLELSHYPGLCERLIDTSARQLLQQHGARSALVLHRVGRLLPGELIVLVAISADRRGPAQRCCAALLEALKHDAPFWKREWCHGEGTWLSENTPL